MPVIFVDTKDEEVKAMLAKLAADDMRSATTEVVWLIRQEWARRYSQPNPAISLAAAIAAGNTLQEG